jgi:DedD protein
MRLPFFRAKNPDAPVQARPGRGKAAAAAPADEGPVQAARTRARRRLIGALVLLAVGVVGFPVLFETQPRPLPVNTPILLPEAAGARVAGGAGAMPTAPAAARSLPVPPPDAGSESPSLSSAASAAAGVGPTASLGAEPASAAAKKVAVAPVVASAASAPVAQPASAPAKPRSEPVRAEAPKPAKADSEPAATGRFVVQVGAYNDAERLRAARQKVEKLGFKTYTQDVDAPSGKRTRVRLGPFATRAEAEAAAGKVKGAGLQANILAL